MFLRESEMTPSVTRWMKRSGLCVKSEFVTPWGICDLAGVSFNAEHVAMRLQLGQKKPVASITRAALLLQVPDVEDRRSISLSQLARKFTSAIAEDFVANEVDQLIADGFLVRNNRGRLQKRNGWMPLQKRLVAVELKLNRIEEAMKQARANLGFADESYVAFPIPTARRIANAPNAWASFFNDGVGLIGVSRNRCEVLINKSEGSSIPFDPAVRLHAVEKFWRTRRVV